jgi:hypothetical protein
LAASAGCTAGISQVVMFSPHRQAHSVDTPDAPPERIGHSSPTPPEFRWRTGPLAPISLITIMDNLRSWLEVRVHTGLAVVPGTRDAWAAADFAGWLNSSTGSRPARAWDIELDAAIYDDRDQRVALLFNRRTFTQAYPVIAMGVRVQTFMMTQARFLQGVEAELTRLELQLRRAEFANAERHLLVVTMDAEGLAAVMPHGLEVRAVLTEGPAVLWRGFRRPG